MEPNELDVDSKIVNKVIAKIIESDPDLVGIIKNLLKKSLDRDNCHGEEKLENLVASKVEIQILEARLQGLENRLGLESWRPYEYNSMSILDRVKVLERAMDNLSLRLENLENELEYGKYSDRYDQN
jgi:hypothetical protein